MELQLGLALPSNPIKGFDLNKYFYDPKEVVASETWSHHSGCLGKNRNSKRSFEDAFEMVSPFTRTLPLLSWNDKPSDDDDPKSLEKCSSCTINKREGNGIVGWPPINHWRKKLHYQNQGGRLENGRRYEKGCWRPNSTYVKVKMEGAAIGRKVDLNLHRSYQTLTNTLIDMFDERSVKGSKDGTRYTLTYQDREGDWLLVGDVPWQTFIGSVQRLKILKSGG